MKTNDLFKLKVWKLLLPLLAILFIIALFKNGYQFGQWLFKIMQ